MLTVEIQRGETSEGLVYKDVLNAYTKGPLYCILFKLGRRLVVHKFPLCTLFRIIEHGYRSHR